MQIRWEVRAIKNISFQIDDEFHKNIKIQATKEDLTIKDYIIELIKKDLKTSNVKQPQKA